MAIRYTPKGGKKQPTSQPAPKPSTAERKARAGKTPRAARKSRAVTKTTVHALASLTPSNVTIEEIHQLNTLEEFRNAGMVILRRTVDAVIWFAELLWEGKKRLAPEEFEQLQRDLSVASTTAVQYITTAKSERIRKLRDDESVTLPPAAHTLYLLASMSDDEYKAFLKEHAISKDLTTTEVRTFRVAFKEKAELAHLPKTTKAAEQQATQEAADEATAPVEAGADPHEFAQAPEISESAPGETVQQGGYALFQELAQGILEIPLDDIRGSFEGIDADEAEKRFRFTTEVTEHLAQVHALVADLQFAISNP